MTAVAEPTTAVAEPTTAVAEPTTAVAAQPEESGQPVTRDILIINYSGDLEKTWATMILASTGAAMGVKVRVFLTFWGLQTFVKDGKRITGTNWMQKLMSFMQRPGVSHRHLSQMNFLGMGPWMMRKLAKRYKVASPKELLEIAMEMGVEFLPCQMTMDMFGLRREDMIEGIGEPVGAATVISLMTEGSAPLFI